MESTASPLHALDQRLAELRERFPGWNLWYVYRAKEHGGPIWCGQPLPLINTDSPEHLAQEIEMAHPAEGPDSDSQSLERDEVLPLYPEGY